MLCCIKVEDLSSEWQEIFWSGEEMGKGQYPPVLVKGEVLSCIRCEVARIVEPPQIFRDYRAENGRIYCLVFEDDWMTKIVRVRLRDESSSTN